MYQSKREPKFKSIVTMEPIKSSSTLPFALLGALPLLPKVTKVTTPDSWATLSHYGPVLSSKQLHQAAVFVSRHTDVKILEMEQTLQHFLNSTLEDFLKPKTLEKEHTSCWLAIRLTQDTKLKTPRWHRDGRMFQSDDPDEIHSKYATVLLGQTTHILADSQLVSDVIDSSKYQLRNEENAVKLAGEPLVPLNIGDIIRFTWGEKDSPVHSEPDLKGDRIFVSVLYGTEAELKRMCEIREEKYVEEEESEAK